MSSVLIAGAGIMGHGIAVCFLQAGWRVTLVDPADEARDQAVARIEAALDLLQSVAGRNRPTSTALERLSVSALLPDEVPRLAIETVPEDLARKHQVLRELASRQAGDGILCTNTSALEIASLAVCLEDPARLVGTHFWNPPYILPCVEVVPGPATDEVVVDDIIAILRQIDRRPVALKHDLPGFVGNRLQHALQREALAIAESGVVSPEELDAIVRGSFGLRAALMGPFERADLGGIDTTLRVHQYLLPSLADSDQPSRLLTDRVAAGDLGARTGKGFYAWDDGELQDRIRQRDETLLRMLKLIEESTSR